MEQEQFNKLFVYKPIEKATPTIQKPLPFIKGVWNTIQSHLPQPIPPKTDYGPDLNDYE